MPRQGHRNTPPANLAPPNPRATPPPQPSSVTKQPIPAQSTAKHHQPRCVPRNPPGYNRTQAGRPSPAFRLVPPPYHATSQRCLFHDYKAVRRVINTAYGGLIGRGAARIRLATFGTHFELILRNSLHTPTTPGHGLLPTQRYSNHRAIRSPPTPYPKPQGPPRWTHPSKIHPSTACEDPIIFKGKGNLCEILHSSINTDSSNPFRPIFRFSSSSRAPAYNAFYFSSTKRRFFDPTPCRACIALPLRPTSPTSPDFPNALHPRTPFRSSRVQKPLTPCLLPITLRPSPSTPCPFFCLIPREWHG